MLNTNLSSINQTEIQGLLNSCLLNTKETLPFFGHSSLMELLSQQVLTSSEAKKGQWELKIESEAHFILRRPDDKKASNINLVISQGGNKGSNKSSSQ